MTKSEKVIQMLIFQIDRIASRPSSSINRFENCPVRSTDTPFWIAEDGDEGAISSFPISLILNIDWSRIPPSFLMIFRELHNFVTCLIHTRFFS